MSLRLMLIPCVLLLSVCHCRIGQAQGGSTGTPAATGTPAGATGGVGSGLTGSGTSGISSPGTTGTTAAQSFIGGNATQSFVGGGLQATQQATNRQFQAIQSMNSQSDSQSQTTGTPREVRTTISIGFSFPTATTAQSPGRLSSANEVSLSRFAGLRPEFSGISVAMTSQGIAVLTGSTVSTESKRLAANLMRLQPGVRKVDNQVAVN